MKKAARAGLVVLGLVGGFLSAPGQELEWVRFAGGGYDLADAVALAPEGGAYVALLGETPFRIGEQVFTNVHRFARFVARYGADGAVAWARQLESPSFDPLPPAGMFLSVEASGGLLAAGTFSQSLSWLARDAGQSNALPTEVRTLPGAETQDVFLMRWDADGNLREARSLGGADEQTCTGAVLDGGGDLLLCGAFRGMADFPPARVVTAPEGHWVGRFSPALEARWTAGFGGESPLQQGPRMAVDREGNVLVAGTYRGALSIHGGPVMVTFHEFNLYVAKLSPVGRYLWVKGWGYDVAKDLHSLALDDSGNVYVSAGVASWVTTPPPELVFDEDVRVTARAYLLKLNAEGEPLWVRPGGYRALKPGPDGTMYGAGEFEDLRIAGSQSFLPLGGRDVLLARWDADGNVLWARAFADSGQDAAGELAVEAAGGVWLAGSASHAGPSVFPGPTFAGMDAVVAHYAPPAPGSPRILRQPEEQKLAGGGTASLSVDVAGDGELSFQWLHQGVEVSDNDRIRGSRSAELTIQGVDRADEGDYLVRIHGSGGAIFSSAARLHVLAAMKFTSIAPLPGSQGALRMTFLGSPGVLYRFEVSENLVFWTHLTNSGPNTLNPGEIAVVDRVSPVRPSRFYRAISQ